MTSETFSLFCFLGKPGSSCELSANASDVDRGQCTSCVQDSASLIRLHAPLPVPGARPVPDPLPPASPHSDPSCCKIRALTPHTNALRCRLGKHHGAFSPSPENVRECGRPVKIHSRVGKFRPLPPGVMASVPTGGMVPILFLPHLLHFNYTHPAVFTLRRVTGRSEVRAGCLSGLYVPPRSLRCCL